MATRYDPAGIQAEFEPGSRSRVLRNLLGIVRVRDMAWAESQALSLAQAQAVEIYSQDQRFSAKDVCDLHRLWLGDIYAWAGEYRNVNMAKGGFPFAASQQIPRLMREFERSVLARHTPCRTNSSQETAKALAVVHGELILIHPFREGNGRLARLIALLMGLQAGLPPLDFSPLQGRGKRRYFAGVQATMGKDYRLLTEMFERVIDRTWTSASSSGR
jgi:cell filamentation protein